jgi:hypothetical protein
MGCNAIILQIIVNCHLVRHKSNLWNMTWKPYPPLLNSLRHPITEPPIVRRTAINEPPEEVRLSRIPITIVHWSNTNLRNSFFKACDVCHHLICFSGCLNMIFGQSTQLLEVTSQTVRTTGTLLWPLL